MAPLRWLWRYSDSTTGHPIGKGTLTTNSKPDRDGFYRVRSIRGQRDGTKFHRLVPDGNGIPGNVDPITGRAYVGDNLIRPKSQRLDAAQLTSGGIGFSLVNKTFVNLFELNSPPQPTSFEFFSAPPYPVGPVPPNTEALIRFNAWIQQPS